MESLSVVLCKFARLAEVHAICGGIVFFTPSLSCSLSLSVSPTLSVFLSLSLSLSFSFFLPPSLSPPVSLHGWSQVLVGDIDRPLPVGSQRGVDILASTCWSGSQRAQPSIVLAAFQIFLCGRVAALWSLPWFITFSGITRMQMISLEEGLTCK